MPLPDPAPRIRAVNFFVTALFLAATSFLLASCLPFATVRSHLDGYAQSGSAAVYSEAVHSGIIARLRVAGAACLAVALLAWRCRTALACAFGRATCGIRDDLKRVGATLRQTVSSDRATVGALLALIALAAAIRVPSLISEPMRYDESATYSTYASRPYYTIVARYESPNNHVFHTLCVRAAILAFGDRPWAIRLPAFLAGLLLVPAGYVAGRALYGRGAALLGAALIAGSPTALKFSTNARGYTIVALATLLMVAVGSLLLRRPSVLAWGALTVLAALGFWAVPVMLLPYVAVMGWLVLAGVTAQAMAADRGTFLRSAALSALGTVALVVLLYAPILLLHGPGVLGGNRYVVRLGWEEWRAGLPSALAAPWAEWLRELPAGLGIVLTAAFVFHHRADLHRIPFWAVAPVVCIAIILIQGILPPERVWFFALPLFLLAAAAGLAWIVTAALPKMWCRPALAGTAALLLGVQTLGTPAVKTIELGTLRDAPAVTDLLRARLRPGDAVLATCPSDGPLEYYFGRCGLAPDLLLWCGEPVRVRGNRLFAVVNKTHGQTLESVLAKYRLDRDLDLASAQRHGDFETAEVFELATGGN